MWNRIIGVLTVLFFCCGANAERTKVTFMVFYDLSTSMGEHYSKMKDLVPLVEDAMSNSRCEYQVSVSNIFYQDEIYNDMTPIGDPAFITEKDGKKGILKIKERLLYPFYVGRTYMQPDGSLGLPVGAAEETYTSLVKGIKHNLGFLHGQDVVGTLLLTDATPGLDPMDPLAAMTEIKSMLGSTFYMPAVIGYPYKKDMMDTYPQESCQPDFPKGTVLPPVGASDLGINSGAWPNPDIEALNKFVKAGFGHQWDICRSDYKAELRDYITEVLTAAGCNLMM